jgi:hypothetical protein
VTEDFYRMVDLDRNLLKDIALLQDMGEIEYKYNRMRLQVGIHRANSL